jgi:hypothetical protein
MFHLELHQRELRVGLDDLHDRLLGLVLERRPR